MRLTLKLSLALTFILSAQFALYGYLVARRLTGFFERDIKRDALHIGRTLSTAVVRTWKNQGYDQALALVSDTNDDNEGVNIRMVRVSDDPVEVSLRPALPPVELAPLRSGKFFVKHSDLGPDSDYVYTYVRVPIDSPDINALELRQSFTPEIAFTRVSVIRIGIFLLVVISTTVLVMWVLGLIFIARPIAKLCLRMRQIGQGDFDTKLAMSRSDEIGTLAHEINQMNHMLRTTKAALDKETAEKSATLEQLRHADRLTTIGTLASGVAHELGTPLNVASGHLGLLVTARNDPLQVERACAAVTEQLDKMAGIVAQLLSFSRRRTPQMSMRDIDSILRKVIKMLTPFAQKRDLEIQYSVLRSIPLANVDEGQMEQVFTNLLVNAIQAMDSGEIIIHLGVEKTSSPDKPNDLPQDYVCASFTDFGIGMDRESLDRIFDPFYTTKAPGQGTGMGLSIAHGIISEHAGWISVTSAPGKGSCFSVFIPAGEFS